MNYDQFIECLVILDDIRDCLYQLKYCDFLSLDLKVMIKHDLELIKEYVGGN